MMLETLAIDMRPSSPSPFTSPPLPPFPPPPAVAAAVRCATRSKHNNPTTHPRYLRLILRFFPLLLQVIGFDRIPGSLSLTVVVAAVHYSYTALYCTVLSCITLSSDTILYCAVL